VAPVDYHREEKEQWKVRHVKIMGLCMVALFAVSAMALGVASPALATTKKEEKAIAKNWDVFKNCPYNTAGVELCTYGSTYHGVKGGFYTIGSAKVALSDVVIQAGIHENSETGLYELFAPTDGAQTLESPPEPVTGGLKLITPAIQQSSGWPEALKQAYNEALKNHEGTLDAKIEVGGGNVLYETPGALNTTNLIFEEGPAFKLPIKVKLESPFLAKLGGGPCVVGNETTPIWQELTSEPKVNGTAGNLEILYEGNEVILHNGRLGAQGWSIPEAALAQGCGGEYESQVDAAIDYTLQGYNHAEGITLLSGALYESVAKNAKEYLEEGKTP
jgi:hypothetical protein